MAQQSNSEIPIASQFTSVVNLSAGSDLSLVAAVAGKRIVVLYGHLATGAATATIFFESSTTTALTGVIPIPVWTIWPIDPPDGILALKTASGESLTATVTGGDIDGWIVYTLVQAQ